MLRKVFSLEKRHCSKESPLLIPSNFNALKIIIRINKETGEME